MHKCGSKKPCVLKCFKPVRREVDDEGLLVLEDGVDTRELCSCLAMHLQANLNLLVRLSCKGLEEMEKSICI